MLFLSVCTSLSCGLERLSAFSALARRTLARHVLIAAAVFAFRLALLLSVHIRYERFDLGYGILAVSC